MIKRFRKPILMVFAFFAVSAVNADAQTTTFSDPLVDFTFEIPDARWKVVAKNPYVNLVFGTAKEGDLEIRKVSAPSNKLLSDVIREDEEKLQFLPGYVAGKEENFSGALRGSIFNYEYVKAGRNMAGRFYYLRSGESVYVLRFTAYTTNLRSLRVQTDVMARTFQITKN